jgi:hypothetical protein
MNERIEALRQRLSERLPEHLRRRLQDLPRIPGGLRLWITLGSLGFVLAAVAGHGRQVLQLRLDPQGWLWLALGVGVSLLSVLVNGLAQGVVLLWLGARPRWVPLLVLYATTNLRKYLPGGIWHLASRVQAFRRPAAALASPLSTTGALLAALLDPLLAAVAALALVPFGGWQRGLGLLCLLPLVLLMPRWLDPLLRRLERRRATELGLSEELAGESAVAPAALRRYPWPPLLAELVFVLSRFAGFACCVWAFDLQLSLDWFTWLAGFALAWTLGLVVPGAPGGLGVFEAVLLLRLGGALAEPSLLAVMLSYRLVVTLADLLAAAVVTLDERLASPKAPAPSQ